MPEKGGMGIWDYFEILFDRHAVLSDNPAFAEKYYNCAFRYYCRCHIQHVEIHMMMTGTMDETAEYLYAVQRAYRNVKKEYPDFTVRVIGTSLAFMLWIAGSNCRNNPAGRI